TFAAILRAEPNWAVLPTTTPAPIRRVLKRCLEKDPRERLHDIADARLEIRDTKREPRQGAPARPSLRWHAAWFTGGIAAAVAPGVVVWRVARPAEVPRPLLRFSIDLPDQLQLSGLNRRVVAISPDGTHLAYVANSRLYVRAADQLEAKPIAGTEAGGANGFARAPFFSPDGQWIAFWQQGQLRKVAVSGGVPVAICDIGGPPVGTSWESNGDILAATSAGIVQVPANGGSPKPLIKLAPSELVGDPQMLPGGKWILF